MLPTSLIPSTDESANALAWDGAPSLSLGVYSVNSGAGVGASASYRTPASVAAVYFNQRGNRNAMSFVLKQDLISPTLPVMLSSVAALAGRKPAAPAAAAGPVVAASTSAASAAATTSSASSAAAVSDPKGIHNWLQHLTATFSYTRASRQSRTTLAVQTSSANGKHHVQALASLADRTLHSQYVLSATPRTLLGLQTVVYPSSDGTFVHAELQVASRAYTHPVSGKPVTSLFGGEKGAASTPSSASAAAAEAWPVDALAGNVGVPRAPENGLAAPVLVPIPGGATAATSSSAKQRLSGAMNVIHDLLLPPPPPAPAPGAKAPEAKPWLSLGFNVATTFVAQAVAAVQVTPTVRLTALADTDLRAIGDHIAATESVVGALDNAPFSIAWGLRYG